MCINTLAAGSRHRVSMVVQGQGVNKRGDGKMRMRILRREVRVDVNLDSVVIEGQELKRSDNLTRSEWQRLWQGFKAYTNGTAPLAWYE